MTKKKQYSKKAKKINKRNSRSINNKPKIKFLINKKMTFGEIMNRYPQAGEILMNKGMHCFGCGMAFAETLEQGALMHGINPDKLVDELNKKFGKKK